jgi:hypothetical protein
MNATSFVFGIVGFGFSARLGERRLTIFEEQLLPFSKQLQIQLRQYIRLTPAFSWKSKRPTKSAA